MFLQKGAVLQNNKVTSDDKGSAINLTGAAELEMNYGEIKDNVSKTGGAVYHNGGKLAVKNAAVIKGNVDDANKERNLVLGDGKKVEVLGPLVDDLGASADIKVTVKVAPAASTGTTTTSADQEAIIAAPSATYTGVADSPAFLSNFSFDEETTMNNRGWNLKAGNPAVGNAKKVVATRAGRLITFRMVEYPDDTAINASLWDAAIPATPVPVLPNAPFEKNASVDASDIKPPTLPTTSKYIFKDVQLDMNGGTGLSIGTEAEGYKLKGTMPDSEVTVTYRYERKNSTFKFDINGGSPTIADKVGPQLSNLEDRSVPVVTKYGYNFKYWDPTPNPTPDGDEILITGQLPAQFPKGKVTGPAAEQDVFTYKAIWEVNEDIKSTLLYKLFTR